MVDVGAHLLGRIPSPPDRRDFELAPYLEPLTPLFPPGEPAVWTSRTQLDQENTPHCVGFGWTHLLNAEPVPASHANLFGHDLYYRIKIEEAEPGQENGAYVRSGGKVLQAEAKLGAYAFAANGAEVRAWLRAAGPVVVGTWWTSDMFTPAHTGWVFPTGRYEGGHCYLVLGDVPDPSGRSLGYAICQNSWGADWGPRGGLFMLEWSDLDRLLEEDGEAVTSVELAEARPNVCACCGQPLPEPVEPTAQTIPVGRAGEGAALA